MKEIEKLKKKTLLKPKNPENSKNSKNLENQENSESPENPENPENPEKLVLKAYRRKMDNCKIHFDTHRTDVLHNCYDIRIGHLHDYKLDSMIQWGYNHNLKLITSIM